MYLKQLKFLFKDNQPFDIHAKYMQNCSSEHQKCKIAQPTMILQSASRLFYPAG